MSPLFLLVAILFPSVAGMLALKIRFSSVHAGYAYMEVIAILTTIMTWVLLLNVAPGSSTLYTFAPGFSITLGIDALGKLYAGLVSLMWPIVLIYAFAYMEDEERQRSFFAFYVLTYGVTLGVCFSENLFTLFFFFEALSLSTLPLVSQHQDPESRRAARLYGTYLFGGATLAFVAVVAATIYGHTGAFHFGGDLTGDFHQDWIRLLYLFGFFGFGVKAAVLPFYKWLPIASCAPMPVTGLLHAVAVVNTGVFSVIRLTWYTFGPDLIRASWAHTTCLLITAATLLYAAALAVREHHMKRRLAYSTVSNLSYMLFAVMLLTPAGLTAGIAHLIFHSLTKITLFLCIGSFMHVTHKSYLNDVGGAAKYMPLTFVFFTVSGLSLTGLPGLCVFISKWRILSASIAEGSVGALIGIGCLLVAAFFCAIYNLSISIRAFFPMRGTDRFAGQRRSNEGGWRMLLPIGCFTACQIYFGLHPEWLLAYIEKIAGGLG